ncbi:MAG: hypothetical protein LJF30_23175 [Acidobacteria bacterium]|nr:hypothetical protein [Acidobacteriota bacterium]
MVRRAGFPVLLLALGLVAGVLVARVPPDLERTVVTRRHHTSDPLHTAVLLRFDVDSLLHHPTRYFQPPFLYPDPNPMRGTEPLIAEALLAVPFRLLLGDRPAGVFTWVRIVTLALLTFATGLMLKELGTSRALALLGGGLAVLVASTPFFFDRLQAVSLQWLPLGIFFAARYGKRGRLLDLGAFGVCVFLTIQASLYTTVMLLAVVPFLLPLARHGLMVDRRRTLSLGGAALAAGAVSILVLWPYLTRRGDIAVYSSAAFVGEKSWGAAALNALLTTAPEYEANRWPPSPPARWGDVYPDAAVYPGAAFVLMVAVVALLALVDGVRARRDGRAPPGGVATRGALALLLTAFVGTVAHSAWAGPSSATRFAAGGLLWVVLVAWWLRLARWPRVGDSEGALRLLASASSLAALVLLFLSFGSPVRLEAFGPGFLEGLFRPLSSVFTPLRELRELKRFLMPAGWAAVVAFVLMLELRLRRRAPAAAAVLATVLLALGLGERLRADTRKVFVPPPPAPYALLEDSSGTGGLLELPFEPWGQVRSVQRMLWQPSHGRPIVAGKTGIDPGWYTPAREVFNEFPSDESVRLMRTWGLDSVLDHRPDAAPLDGATLPEGVVPRGRQRDRGGRREWRLYDVLGSSPALTPEPTPGPGTWRRPGGATGDAAAPPATDGSPSTAGEITSPDGLELRAPDEGIVVALELDYGPGRFNRVPPQLSVLGLVDGEWTNLTMPPSGTLLRARAAEQLLRHQSARLVITLQPSAARRLRLLSSRVPWDLPEVRVRVRP